MISKADQIKKMLSDVIQKIALTIALIIALTIIIISFTTVVSRSYIGIGMRIARYRLLVSTPEYTVEYIKNHIDEVLYVVKVNCEAVSFDNILTQEEYNNGEPEKETSYIFRYNPKLPSITNTDSGRMEWIDEEKNKYIYCANTDYGRLLVGNRYIILDYSKIISGYKNLAPGTKLRTF